MSVVTRDGTVGLGLRRISASSDPDPEIKAADTMAILVDVSSCIGCKGCEAACVQWHDLRPPIPTEEAIRAAFSYQSHPDLLPNLFMLMQFREGETDRGTTWFINKYQCMHCDNPGCLEACPAPGAIIQYQNGIVDFDQAQCIGCRMCLVGCPFDVPRFDGRDKPWKCNFCVDRVSAGLEPACAKACPTNALTFGLKSEMVKRGKRDVQQLKERGFGNAVLYDPQGVNGTGYIYVLPHGDQPEMYGLPKEASISPWVSLWQGPLKVIGGAALLGGLIGIFLRHITFGPTTAERETEE